MRVTISAPHTEIMRLIKEELYVTGESNKYNDISETRRATKTQASAEDDNLLNKYMTSSASTVSDLLASYLVEMISMPQLYMYVCEMPATFSESEIPAISDAIVDYIAEYTKWKWYKRTDSRLADATELERIKSDINHRFNLRSKPVRRPVLPLNF